MLLEEGVCYDQAAAMGTLSMAERSYPTSEVRGSGGECQTAMVQEWLRGATPRPRSGGTAERRYPASEVRGVDERSYPTSEVRGGCREELPHDPKPEARGGGREEQPRPRPGATTRGVTWTVAVWAQEGLEELSHIEGQEGRR